MTNKNTMGRAQSNWKSTASIPVMSGQSSHILKSMDVSPLEIVGPLKEEQAHYRGQIFVKRMFGYLTSTLQSCLHQPVATEATIFILFAIALYYVFNLEVINVEVAFLKADLDKHANLLRMARWGC